MLGMDNDAPRLDLTFKPEEDTSDKALYYTHFGAVGQCPASNSAESYCCCASLLLVQVRNYDGERARGGVDEE